MLAVFVDGFAEGEPRAAELAKRSELDAVHQVRLLFRAHGHRGETALLVEVIIDEKAARTPDAQNRALFLVRLTQVKELPSIHIREREVAPGRGQSQHVDQTRFGEGQGAIVRTGPSSRF